VSRILVTGAGGYIGSAVARLLSGCGHSVLATARSTDRGLGKILSKCELRTLDVLAGPYENLPRDVEVVVHTATSNDILSRDFGKGMELSVNGTQRLLQWSRSIGVRRFIFFSTFQVYGTELRGAIDESTCPAPLNDYGLNHLCGEELCAMHARVHGLEVALVRPANVCGCPQSPTVNRETLVPMCFVREALTSGRITLRSSGLQARDFVTVRQVADATRWLCEAPLPASPRVVNVASGTTWTVLDLARWTADACQRRIGREIPIIVESSQPASSNEFHATSCVPASAAPATTRDEIIAEIEKTLELFKPGS
jgi:UDP-glucose 4-epimerase